MRAHVLGLCLLFPATATVFGQNAPPPPAQTVTQVLDRSVSADERAILALARAMPENRYQFVPTRGAFKGVRSFAQLVMHVAVANYQMGSDLLGEKVPIDVGRYDNGPETIKTKAQIIKFLEDSFIYLHKAVATVNEKNMLEMVEYPDGGRVSKLGVVTAAICHPMDIYGQMIEYLRMNNIDPQAL